MWIEDILGPGFEQLTLELGEDDEGPLVATLVRHLPDKRDWFERAFQDPRPLDNTDVLYVHGWNDYFFQAPLAQFFAARGARFYALDLRKYGRSLRDGQSPGYITDLEDYDLEIGLALKEMRRAPGGSRRKLLLMGHSTGGLVLSLWANRHRGVADGVILNAPWVALQVAGQVARAALSTIVSWSAAVNPLRTSPQFDFGFYSRAQQLCRQPEDTHEINEHWRPERSHPVRSAWLNAIITGHRAVNERLHIDAPILTLLSLRSELPLAWSEDLTRADTVLEVEETAYAVTKLGPSVTLERIDNALHDVFLSRKDARAEAYRRLDLWLAGWAETQN